MPLAVPGLFACAASGAATDSNSTHNVLSKTVLSFVRKKRVIWFVVRVIALGLLLFAFGQRAIKDAKLLFDLLKGAFGIVDTRSTIERSFELL